MLIDVRKTAIRRLPGMLEGTVSYSGEPVFSANIVLDFASRRVKREPSHPTSGSTLLEKEISHV
jgi:hypothetical protein